MEMIFRIEVGEGPKAQPPTDGFFVNSDTDVGSARGILVQ